MNFSIYFLLLGGRPSLFSLNSSLRKSLRTPILFSLPTLWEVSTPSTFVLSFVFINMLSVLLDVEVLNWKFYSTNGVTFGFSNYFNMSTFVCSSFLSGWSKTLFDYDFIHLLLALSYIEAGFFSYVSLNLWILSSSFFFSNFDNFKSLKLIAESSFDN